MIFKQKWYIAAAFINKWKETKKKISTKQLKVRILSFDVSLDGAFPVSPFELNMFIVTVASFTSTYSYEESIPNIPTSSREWS